MSLTFFYAILFLFTLNLIGNLLGMLALRAADGKVTSFTLGFSPFIGSRKLAGVPVDLGYVPFLGGGATMYGATQDESEALDLEKAYFKKSGLQKATITLATFVVVPVILVIYLISEPTAGQTFLNFFQGMFFNFDPQTFWETTFNPSIPRSDHAYAAKMALLLDVIFWTLSMGPGVLFRMVGELGAGGEEAGKGLQTLLMFQFFAAFLLFVLGTIFVVRTILASGMWQDCLAALLAANLLILALASIILRAFGKVFS